MDKRLKSNKLTGHGRRIRGAFYMGKIKDTKKECRNCKFWKERHDCATGDCINPKSMRFETTPLYDSTCRKFEDNQK